MLSATVWRRLSYVLMLILLITLVRLHLRTGYPKEWNNVQVGMAASQVNAICGKPTYDSGGMKPNRWEVPFLWGKWVMQVSGGDYENGDPDIVYSVAIYFDHNISNARSNIHIVEPPIRDYRAFIRAFGIEPNPHEQYRMVPKEDEIR